MATAEFDLVIRGGEVHDGTGADPVHADVGIKDGKVVALGDAIGSGTDEVDASGKIVTPGFVDIHTHYDGQAVWDETTAPSSQHGVTTVLMGNCGVGFAPCRPEHHDVVVDFMEGIEDIPAPVMHQGLPWTWETFEEYLDVLDTKKRDLDVCTLVPHGPLRVYVMGDRALRLEPALADDIAKMRSIVADAVRAGAFGVSTTRSTFHRTLKGDPTPTLLAREREILGIAMGLADAGGGIYEFLLETSDPEVLGEYGVFRRALEKSGARGLYNLIESQSEPDIWRTVMAFSDEAMASGVHLRGVAAPRAIGLLMGLQANQHPFSGTATFQKIAELPMHEQVQRMRDPEVRACMLADDPSEYSTWVLLGELSYDSMYRFGNPVNYTPDINESISKIAQRENRTPQEVAYDLMLEDDGKGLIYVPFSNYVSGDLSTCQEMLANPNVIMGLGDGGAHMGFVLDASFQTFMLTYWARERGVLSIAEAVRRMTTDTADEIGLTDRGRIKPGARADLNVIDMDRLSLGTPYAAYDLPASGKRLMQKAVGYEATIVAGEITYREGEETGARPGGLVRSGSFR